MATKECITDDLLCELAEDIETGEQMEILGRTLGFKPAAINRYAETNRLEGRVTCKGTRDMLFDWRQTVEPSNQHPRLKQALNDANLIMLAETYIKESQSAEDIYCQNISESLTVRQCREKLENRYLNDLCRIQMKPWDKTDYAEFKNMHTTVTLVKKDANGQDLAKKVELEGSVSEIFSTKVNDALPVRILISAPAGRGKTTAVAKMAYDWVKKKGGSALEHLPLLFVVKLRKTSHHTSIGEAIISELLSDVDDLTPEGLESFIRRNQTMCHIILDGLDEYAGISSSNNIVSIIRWKEFPECRVLITTRPYLENYFNEGELLKVYTKMWIEGFSEESSRKYIDKFFTLRPEKTQNLKKYLSDQPLIGELVKSPLFCLMVCHLWSEGILDTKTTTQTELLDSVNIFLMHHANRRSQSERGITEEDLNLLIQKLGKVALAGLLDDSKKLVFTRHDFRRVPYIVDRACEIGILSKTTITASKLPRTHKPTSIAIEFYHKLVQEHSAGKYIAAKSKRRMLTCRTPYLDRVLHKITEHIGEYENLIRFTAGTDNNLGVQIMGALLENEHLDESERYRILLDCSSETAGNEGNVKSLISKCVNATAMLLKSPTLYTVVGMQNLPDELKRQVKKVKFIGSTFSGDLTCRLWSCLRTYTSLRTLIISDFSLSFPSSPPELPSVTKLSVEKVTSQSYEGLISSLPDLVNIDITFDNAEGDISRFTAGLRQTGEQDHTHIILRAPSSLPSERRHVSRETMRGLGLLIRQRFKNLKWIGLSGIIGLNEEDLVELLESSTSLASLAHLNLE
ncbi:uncharacterized protein LOC121416908 isoform X1 [Lytechinus variegatus]|uniref:uncharacterized protein LOC121416908 isoform X1 n=1 Tax=Lytechinus variegatus TaxID=7654 RepID=UPI001BB11FCD|nr:uncharacterized protein LOC121416908 isoform X1 [Lytechinus variegatus]